MLQTEYAKGTKIAPMPDCSGAMSSIRAEITLTAAQLTANQIVEMAPLLAGCELVDAILDSDVLDTDGTPAVTLNVGVMNGELGALLDADGNARTCGSEVFSGSNVGQAGGLARPTAKTAVRIASSDKDRSIGIKIGTAPDAAQAGTVGLTLIYRAA
jgi:hypothetical protein